MRNEIFAIHGGNACGKSTIVSLLREHYPKYNFYSTGDFAREMAAQQKMDIETYIKYVREENIPYDDLLDERLKEIAKSNQNWIIDSRLAYFFIPHAFKVYIYIDPSVAVSRRYEQLISKDPSQRDILTKDAVRNNLQERYNHDQSQYLKKYNTNIGLIEHYDYFISNNANFQQGRVVGEIMLAQISWLKSK